MVKDQCQAMDGVPCHGCPQDGRCPTMDRGIRVVLHPVATLLAFDAKGNRANLDYAYTDQTVKDHVDVAFEDSACLVAVKWRDEWYVCVPRGGGYARRAAAASEAVYYERLVEEV